MDHECGGIVLITIFGSATVRISNVPLLILNLFKPSVYKQRKNITFYALIPIFGSSTAGI